MLPAGCLDSIDGEHLHSVTLTAIGTPYQTNHHLPVCRDKEQLAEGLHLIDFEQLKIENQSLNEKIEERNEELIKLRKKTTITVQVRLHAQLRACVCRVVWQQQEAPARCQLVCRTLCRLVLVVKGSGCYA